MKTCQTAGEPCTGHHECCSGVCANPGTGVTVCQYVSGCRPIGEVCLDNDDCCSAQCVAYETSGVKRCEKPGGCMAAGEVCWLGQAANCCPQGAQGGNKLCLPTLLTVTRCFGVGTNTTCIPDGQPCHFGDECCNKLCLPDASGKLVCAKTCVPLKGACTADGDCCDGVCLFGSCQPSPTGCAPLGAKCKTNTDCCGGYCGPNGVCTLQ